MHSRSKINNGKYEYKCNQLLCADAECRQPARNDDHYLIGNLTSENILLYDDIREASILFQPSYGKAIHLLCLGNYSDYINSEGLKLTGTNQVSIKHKLLALALTAEFHRADT